MVYLISHTKYMPLYQKGDKSLYHPHIPRTGGRYVKYLMMENGFNCYFSGFEHKIQEIEVPHTHYPLYDNFLEGVKDSENFVIVRNPYDRFISAAKVTTIARDWPKDEFFKYLENKDWCFKFLDFERNIHSYYTNWYRPQWEFVSPKSKVYKFEDLLGKQFVNWMNENYSLQLINFEIEHKIDGEVELESKKINIPYNEKIEANIREYYAEDYSKFSY